MGKDTAIYKPLYIEKQLRVRALAGFIPGLLVTESGTQYECYDAGTLIKCLFAENLILFVRRFSDLPEMEKMMDGAKNIYCNKEGRILAFVLEGARRKTHWIVEVEDWGYAVPVAEVLRELRATFDHCGVGPQNSPGGLGQALMRKSLKDQYGDNWYQHRHRRPSQPVVDILRANSFGARQDAVDARHFDEAIELDMKNAYSFNFRKLPTGICSRTYKEAAWQHATFFAPVRITISKPLKLGLFPIRNLDKSISYPIEPGGYDTWLWREQCEFLKARNLTVEITGPGLAWEEFTTDMEAWSLLMEHLRDTAPSEMTALHIKLATVAGIGRENMPDLKYSIQETGELGIDIPLIMDGLALDWWVHAEHEERPNTLPHWYFYGVAMMALALTIKAFEYQDYLIGTATDAVYLRVDAPGLDQYPGKEEENVPSGTWRKLRHTNVRRWKLGRFKSDQKIVMTGVKKGDREKYLKEETA